MPESLADRARDAFEEALVEAYDEGRTIGFQAAAHEIRRRAMNDPNAVLSCVEMVDAILARV